jgi:hypothetical protein
MKMHQLDRDDTSVITFDDEIPPELTDQEEKSESLFDQLKSDPSSYINIMRQPLGGRNTMEFVARFDADKFDFGGIMNYIQNQYGGGEYRLMAYCKGKLRANQLLSIAHVVTKKENDDSFNHMMLQQIEKLNHQIIAIAQERNTGGNSRKEMLEEMLMYKQLFGGNERSGGFSEIMSVVSGLKELGISVGQPSEEKDGFGDLIGKFAPMATALITASAQQPVNNHRPIRKVNPITPGEKPEKTVNPEPKKTAPLTEEQKMNLALKAGINKLISLAEHRSDTGDAAELVLHNIPEDQAVKLFTDSDLVVKLTSIDRRVSSHKDWFLELAEHIKAQLGMESSVSDQYSDDEDLNETIESDSVASNDIDIDNE